MELGAVPPDHSSVTRTHAPTDTQVLLLTQSIRPKPNSLITINIQPALLHITQEEAYRLSLQSQAETQMRSANKQKVDQHISRFRTQFPQIFTSPQFSEGLFDLQKNIC
jgi:hypothetical protein